MMNDYVVLGGVAALLLVGNFDKVKPLLAKLKPKKRVAPDDITSKLDVVVAGQILIDYLQEVGNEKGLEAAREAVKCLFDEVQDEGN